MSARRFPLWTLLGVVLVVALLVGSGVLRSSPPTAAQRAAAIESDIRCPSCEDLSVAVSSAPTAVTVRSTVRQLVDQGWTDARIEDYLVARYGSTIVLDPSTSGWSALVWVLPVAGGLVAVAGLAVVLRRRRRSGDAGLDADVRGATADPAVVEERRAFLTKSLADADAEYLAGDLGDADYLALRQRDLGRLAALGPVAPGPGGTGAPSPTRAPSPSGSATLVAEAPEAPAPAVVAAEAGAPRRRGRNKWFLIGAVSCFAVALIVAVPLFASDRLPGQTATGSIALSPTQQVARTLDQAAASENEGDLGQAAQLYQQVLRAHPDDEVALAQLGWLEYRIGQQGASTSLLSDARTKITQAVALDPTDYAAHLYLGTLELQLDGNAQGAVDQFHLFLADGPPPSVVSEAASTLRQAFAAAHVPLPSGVPSS
jgi:cytochrome c-type biogenesis protein CcmH